MQLLDNQLAINQTCTHPVEFIHILVHVAIMFPCKIMSCFLVLCLSFFALKVCGLLSCDCVVIIMSTVAREFQDYWPQPNFEDWGNGRVLITTSSPEVGKKHDNNSYSQRYECLKMQENDAVSLLQKMSNMYEKGAKKVVNIPLIDKNPLDIAW